MKSYTSVSNVGLNQNDVAYLHGSSNQKVPISCMFLSHFEMKKGNVMVWSKKWSNTNCDVDLQDIELKSLPSGVHEVTDDVINFVVSKNKGRGEGYYYGVAYFRQNAHLMAENSDQLDRSQVRMYSLGVIINPNYKIGDFATKNYIDWSPNQFTSANEYVTDLEDLLTHWFTQNSFDNFKIFEQYFDENSLSNNILELASPVSQRFGKSAREFLPSRGQSLNEITGSSGRRQMLEFLPYWIRKLGPLIFTLWKSCLLDERVLILNPSGGSFEYCNALTYCLSIISLVPRTITQSKRQENYYTRPLYTIGISDIDGLMSEFSSSNENSNCSGYVACTSDEILTFKTDLFDKVLRIPPDVLETSTTEEMIQVPTIFTNENIQVKATPFEYELTGALFNKLLHEDISVSEKKLYLNEVEPLSWTQYIIDGMYWWATAGYIKPPFHGTVDELEDKIESVSQGDDFDLQILLNSVGFFHDRTADLYNKLNSMILLSSTNDPDEVINISLASLREMGLDCFSSQDHRFVISLAQKWFEKRIQICDDYYKTFC